MIEVEAASVWKQCLDYLREELPAEKFNLWLRPLQAQLRNHMLILWAPNQFVFDWVKDNLLEQIKGIVHQYADGQSIEVQLQIGANSTDEACDTTLTYPQMNQVNHDNLKYNQPAAQKNNKNLVSNLNVNFTFETFVEGKSNQLALAAARQVAVNPGQAYNPLFIYGGVGLGKTHLMHSVGNYVRHVNQNARILYLHSEGFVAQMINALKHNTMEDFKKRYRGLECLLIDDIQFFAGKERSQEEFFHTFNSLLDGQQQIVLTCDRYPKEITGLEERLQSRFGWGLTIAIEPPELETRVAILLAKAEQVKVKLPHEVAFFIAKHIQSNVRELEGALKRVIANAHFTGKSITVDFTREALKDLLTLQAKLVTISNIQRVVAEYYKIKLGDLTSKRRSRSIARPRQIAMSLSKELTSHSLPEIGEAFGGRDHTTVLHACRKIKELIGSNIDIQEDWKNLLRILSG